MEGEYDIMCAQLNCDISDDLKHRNNQKPRLFVGFWSFFLSLEWLKIESSNLVYIGLSQQHWPIYHKSQERDQGHVTNIGL